MMFVKDATRVTYVTKARRGDWIFGGMFSDRRGGSKRGISQLPVGQDFP